MNDPSLPMTQGDWSWLFQTAPQPDPQASASIPTPPIRPASLLPQQDAPSPAMSYAPSPYGSLPGPNAMNNLQANPGSGPDAAALLQSRQADQAIPMPTPRPAELGRNDLGQLGGLTPPATPATDPKMLAMMDALAKRGLISPAQMLAALGMR